jgi:hypothetical protein
MGDANENGNHLNTIAPSRHAVARTYLPMPS